jgi:hypothetical protein
MARNSRHFPAIQQIYITAQESQAMAASNAIRIADVMMEPTFKPAKGEQRLRVDWIDTNNAVYAVEVRVRRIEAGQYALVCPTCGGLSRELRLHYEGRGMACPNCILGLQPIQRENRQARVSGSRSEATAGRLLTAWYERIRQLIDDLRL